MVNGFSFWLHPRNCPPTCFSCHLIKTKFIHSEISLSGETTEAATRRVQWKRAVLEDFAKFPGKQLCQSLFSNKVAGLWPATLLKKRLWHRCFPVNFAKFSRTSFLQYTSGWVCTVEENSLKLNYYELV